MEYSRKRGVSTPQIYLSNQTLVRLQLKLTSFYELATTSICSTKEFYELSIEIFKVLSMDINNRTENPMTFLESVFGRYSSLYANKDIVKFHIQSMKIYSMSFIISNNFDFLDWY